MAPHPAVGEGRGNGPPPFRRLFKHWGHALRGYRPMVTVSPVSVTVWPHLGRAPERDCSNQITRDVRGLANTGDRALNALQSATFLVVSKIA
jgi:hypothetical protein